MLRSLGALGRVLFFACGVAAALVVWRFVLPSFSTIFEAPLGALVLQLSLALAGVLTPFALMGIALYPRGWKFSAIPIVWVLVATIMLRPEALITVF